MAIKRLNTKVRKYFSNPMHLNDESCLHLALSMLHRDKTIITPKVDGINGCCTVDNKYTFEVEIVGNDYYIIDMLEPKLKHIKSYENRLRYISLLFSVPILHNVTTRDDLKKVLKNDRSLVKEDEDIKLYIKPFIHIENYKEDARDDMFLHIQYDEMTLNYPNDGWVVYTTIKKGVDNFYPIKIKPQSELTVDLLYDKGIWSTGDAYKISTLKINKNEHELYDNMIYQLLLESNGVAKVVKPRNDKFKANRYRTFKDVQSLADSVSLCDLMTMYKKCKGSKDLYYNKTRNYVNPTIKSLLTFLKDSAYESLFDILGYGNSILDVGCGGCGLTKKLEIDEYYYYGMDPDPYVLNRHFRPNDHVYKIFGELSYDTLLNSEPLGLTEIDVVVMCNSLYYLDFSDLYALKSVVNTGSSLYIVNMFLDDVKDIEYEGEGFYVKRVIDSESDSDSKDILDYEFKYPWINRDNMIQPLMHSSHLIKKLEKYGWVNISNTRLEPSEETKKYADFIKLHRVVIFMMS